MTKKRKIYLLLAFISLFICIYTTSSTYAKYFSKTDSTKGYNIKKWNIKLNNEDIKTNHKLQEKIKINIETKRLRFQRSLFVSQVFSPFSCH